MADKSHIEWTEASWNPATGCTKVSKGCKYCYAEKMSMRLHAMGKLKYAAGFEYTEHMGAVNLPRMWKKPRRIFVNSMSDLFHEYATHGFLNAVFETMMWADWHTYQILTKRPFRMAEYSNIFADHFDRDIPNHIWCGTSIEDQDVLHRIDALRSVACTVRFISFEPLLGPLGKLDLAGIHWCIIGGESGTGHRLVKKEWILDIIRQCQAQDVPVFFKQWGGPRPTSGGRTIDGQTYDQYPEVAAP